MINLLKFHPISGEILFTFNRLTTFPDPGPDYTIIIKKDYLSVRKYQYLI